MKKFAVFLMFTIMSSVADAADNPYTVTAEQFAKLPYCTDGFIGKCILMPGKKITLPVLTKKKESENSELDWVLSTTTVENTNEFGTLYSRTLCGVNNYIASCGSGDDKITFDMNFLANSTTLGTEATDSEKMDLLRDVGSDSDLKQAIVDYCIPERNIVCKPCPNSAKTRKYSACDLAQGKAMVLTISTMKRTNSKGQTLTGTARSTTTFNVHQCSNQKNIHVNTFWNCNLGSGTDNTGTYVYKDKNTQTDTDCFPAITDLPD